MFVILTLYSLLAAVNCQVNRFPDGFFLGAATAAYQIEGGWNADGKGENIWDHMLHEHPELGTPGQNGDVACDSYHLYSEDIRLLKALNANTYRFSISWSRILPTGDVDKINQPGIDYYNNLINELLANGIEPLVTMYHWDLPQQLQYIGGWPNPILADYFVEYARVLFNNFGDRVKWWITFNEPAVFVSGYAWFGGQAPSYNASGIGDYLAAHTVIKAHAATYRLYDELYRSSQQGHVGITLNIEWREPGSDSLEDIEAADRALQFAAGLYAHPIYTAEGDYPAVVRQRVDTNSQAEGRPRSRLPTFTPEEVNYIRGTSDFFGVNHYHTWSITNGECCANPSQDRDTGALTTVVGDGIQPQGFRKMLNWVSDQYSGYPIIVTENGFGDFGNLGLQDANRTEYYMTYLAELLNAINIDGVPVIGYTAWSLLDNLEWNSGFTMKFGLNQVDFDSPTRTRTPKDSALQLSEENNSETVSDPAPPAPAAAPTTDCRTPVTPAQPPQTTTTRAGRRVRFNPRYL